VGSSPNVLISLAEQATWEDSWEKKHANVP